MFIYLFAYLLKTLLEYSCSPEVFDNLVIALVASSVDAPPMSYIFLPFHGRDLLEGCDLIGSPYVGIPVCSGFCFKQTNRIQRCLEKRGGAIGLKRPPRGTTDGTARHHPLPPHDEDSLQNTLHHPRCQSRTRRVHSRAFPQAAYAR